jgi:hypothetical protein
MGLLRLELEARKLGDPVDQPADFLAEDPVDLG